MADYDFLPASDGTGDAALMHVTAVRTAGATTIAVDTITKVPAKFIASYGTLLPTGYLDPTTKRDLKGHLSGANLIIDAFEPGSTDNGNTIGQVVIIKPNTGWANRVAQFVKNSTGFGTPEPHTVSTMNASGLITAGAGLTVTGASTLASLVLNGSLTGAGLAGQVQSFVNAGSAGGTFYYINLAGIKLMWGLTNPITVGGGGVQINMPAGFWTTIQSATATAIPSTNFAQYANIVSSGPTFFTVSTQGAAGSPTANIIVIGT
jgi:hypothetical protein